MVILLNFKLPWLASRYDFAMCSLKYVAFCRGKLIFGTWAALIPNSKYGNVGGDGMVHSPLSSVGLLSFSIPKYGNVY